MLSTSFSPAGMVPSENKRLPDPMTRGKTHKRYSSTRLWQLAERRETLGEIEAWLNERAISDPAAHSGREGIHDHHAVDLSTRLEVFGEERVASGYLCR